MVSTLSLITVLEVYALLRRGLGPKMGCVIVASGSSCEWSGNVFH